MSIGPQEIVVILILALLIFGPRRLPDIARQVGKAVREVRKVSSEFEREVKTSFALDEHHSTYVTPKQPKDPDGAKSSERAEDGTAPSATEPEPLPPGTASEPQAVPPLPAAPDIDRSDN